jgi:CysZ protein
MNFFTGFIKGFGNCFKAFELIFNKGLWPFLLYPLAIWLVTWILTLFGITLLSVYLTGLIKDLFNIEDSSGFFAAIIAILIKISLFLISGTFSRYILLIVLSPLFALLSEKAEEKLTGAHFPFSFKQLCKDILRGILITLRNITLRNLSIEFGIIILCMILSFFFAPVALITIPFLLFVSWYFTGFTMLDYSAERHKLKAGESTDLIRLNKGYACGIGCVYWLFMILPFFIGDIIGVMFGPAVAVVGATISFLEIRKKG